MAEMGVRQTVLYAYPRRFPWKVFAGRKLKVEGGAGLGGGGREGAAAVACGAEAAATGADAGAGRFAEGLAVAAPPPSAAAGRLSSLTFCRAWRTPWRLTSGLLELLASICLKDVFGFLDMARRGASERGRVREVGKCWVWGKQVIKSKWVPKCPFLLVFGRVCRRCGCESAGDCAGRSASYSSPWSPLSSSSSAARGSLPRQQPQHMVCSRRCHEPRCSRRRRQQPRERSSEGAMRVVPLVEA